MILFKLALRNLVGAGTRTWLNVTVTSITFVLIIFMSGLYQGMFESNKRLMIETEIGGGTYWHPAYDPKDPFTLEDSHGVLPTEIAEQVIAGTGMPVLITQGSIYPEGRLRPVLIKGIPPEQQVVTLPTGILSTYAGEAIPVLIGAGMAKTTKLRVGDTFTARWRDARGTYDADEAEVVSIMNVENFQVDQGQIWVPLERLQRMLEMPDEATYVVVSRETSLLANPGGWNTMSVDALTEDFRRIMLTGQASMSIMYLIFLALAAMGIFNSQVLSIFRRRKEIGTLMALGMHRGRVIGLFTTEGGLHSLLALILAALYGGPFLLWTATRGIPLPIDYAEIGMLLDQRMVSVYPAGLFVGTTLLVTFIVTIVSYLPARKIAKMKPTEAISGRTN
ncbi:MAG: ABC transporter permease [Fidelibacterota bacterium]|nr:MAG: ABC transporter permease [Candidatus Neomarinimicrobiota bacterium]